MAGDKAVAIILLEIAFADAFARLVDFGDETCVHVLRDDDFTSRHRCLEEARMVLGNGISRRSALRSDDESNVLLVFGHAERLA